MRQVSVSLGGSPVLSGIDLKIDPGQMVAFIGPSGAGKTTLLRLLNGSVGLDRGSVEVAGRKVQDLAGTALRNMRRQVGFVHQDFRLVPNLRVSQNVLSGLLGQCNLWQSLLLMLKPSKVQMATAYQLLERVGIPEKLYQRVDKLSGGQAQRVAVARALIQQPSLLVADEPVSSVDPARAREVLRLLTDICRQDGLTLCVSLHDPDLVAEFFPRVVGLREGRIVFDADPQTLEPDQLEQLYALEPDHGV